MIVLTGHTDPVNRLAFTPDSRLLASGSDDGTVRLWDAAKRGAAARISWGAKWVFAVEFSPDGGTLAVGTEASLLLLHAEDGTWKPFHQSREHRGWVTTVAFARDGQLLASGSSDGTVRLWDGVHRRRNSLRAIAANVGAVRAVAFAPHGLAVAAGGTSGIGLWTAAESEPIFFHRLGDADLRALAFAADGSALLAAAGRSVLAIDLETGQSREVLQSTGRYTRAMAAAPDGRFLTGRDDGMVQTWDATGGPDRSYQWHAGAVNAVAVSPDGLTAASAGDDFAVCLWDL